MTTHDNKAAGACERFASDAGGDAKTVYGVCMALTGTMPHNIPVTSVEHKASDKSANTCH